MKWKNIKNRLLDKINIFTFLPELLSRKKKIYVHYALPRWKKKYNWGDDINAILVKLISGRQVIPYQICWYPRKHYLCVGSIIQWYSDKNAIIWGSGLLYPTDKITPPKKILAVRGPLTRECLLKSGIHCPPIYGDPALLFPQFYMPKIKKIYKYGIICHVSEIFQLKNVFCNIPNSIFIDIKNYKKWNYFIDQILSCEIILSSSLHGIIIADAYSIPNLWCKFSQYEAENNGFKFKDYFLSVGKNIEAPHSFNSVQDLKEIEEKIIKSWKKPIIDTDKLLSTCPFKK